MTVQLPRRQVLRAGLGVGAGLIFLGCSGEEAQPTPTTLQNTAPKFPISKFIFVNFASSLGEVPGIESFYDLGSSSLVRWGIEFDAENVTVPFINSANLSIIQPPKSNIGTQSYDVFAKDERNNPVSKLGFVSTRVEGGSGDVYVASFPYNPGEVQTGGPVKAESAPEAGESTSSVVILQRRINGPSDRLVVQPGVGTKIYLSDYNGNLVYVDPNSAKPIVMNSWDIQRADNGEIAIVREVTPGNLPTETTFKGVCAYLENRNTGEGLAIVGLPN